MPIRKPTKTTIRSHDFRNHTFSFPVESILKPQQGTGKLVISASPGYLLTTSSDAEPTQEQTLDHVLQPDGSLLASGTVTLLASNEPATDSTITIRNPSGETVVLTVDATPERLPATQEPTLEVSTRELLFTPGTPGTPAFRVFTLAQQNADTPVTITTDTPELFQLASDSRPAFAPTLTLTPAPAGTYVHVRYTPTRSGRAEAVLTIETPYTTRFIDLTSPRARWLPAVQRPKAVRPPDAEPTPGRRSAVRWVWLVQLLVAGLALAGYQYRCELMPSLCPDAAKPAVSASQPATPVAKPTDSPAENNTGQPKRVETPQTRLRTETTAPKPIRDNGISRKVEPTERSADQPSFAEPTEVAVGSPPVGSARIQSARRAQSRPAADSLRTDQPRRSAVPAPTPGAESELERELNKKPFEQR